MEIEQRLGLYQVFLKLYEHNRGLLDEILQLENTGNGSFIGVRSQYVQGTVQGEQVFLTTNIIGGRTQMLLQPQHVWTFGRDSRVSALTILAQGVSRRHAAIQYVKEQGFYLIDLNSTNGSYVNGEQVYERVLLKDGDRIRLGNIAFTFCLCEDIQTLNEVSPKFLAELGSLIGVPEPITLQDPSVREIFVDWDVSTDNNLHQTSIFLKGQISTTEPLDSNQSLSFSRNQQLQILDRFLNRQIQRSNNDPKSSLEVGDD